MHPWSEMDLVTMATECLNTGMCLGFGRRTIWTCEMIESLSPVYAYQRRLEKKKTTFQLNWPHN